MCLSQSELWTAWTHSCDGCSLTHDETWCSLWWRVRLQFHCCIIAESCRLELRLLWQHFLVVGGSSVYRTVSQCGPQLCLFSASSVPLFRPCISIKPSCHSPPVHQVSSHLPHPGHMTLSSTCVSFPNHSAFNLSLSMWCRALLSSLSFTLGQLSRRPSLYTVSGLDPECKKWCCQMCPLTSGAVVDVTSSAEWVPPSWCWSFSGAQRGNVHPGVDLCDWHETKVSSLLQLNTSLQDVSENIWGEKSALH